MIVRVAERVRLSAVSCVGRDRRRADPGRLRRAAGVDAVLTRRPPERQRPAAEACTLLGLPDDAVVVNVQGDEPLMEPALIEAVAAVASSAARLRHEHGRARDRPCGRIRQPERGQVVLDRRGTAQYFSRAPIPGGATAWARPGRRHRGAAAKPRAAAPCRHLRLPGRFLKAFPALEPAPTEQCESLEQLRVLWHGVQRIAVHVTPHAPGPGVDTQADLERVREIFGARRPAWSCLPDDNTKRRPKPPPAST